jgi:choline dehydrogenase-like flavoprotein
MADAAVETPGAAVKTSTELRDYIRRTALTHHHEVDTAKMGTDELAEVDPQHRHAASLMIGERVAALVAAR